MKSKKRHLYNSNNSNNKKSIKKQHGGELATMLGAAAAATTVPASVAMLIDKKNKLEKRKSKESVQNFSKAKKNLNRAKKIEELSSLLGNKILEQHKSKFQDDTGDKVKKLPKDKEMLSLIEEALLNVNSEHPTKVPDDLTDKDKKKISKATRTLIEKIIKGKEITESVVNESKSDKMIEKLKNQIFGTSWNRGVRTRKSWETSKAAVYEPFFTSRKTRGRISGLVKGTLAVATSPLSSTARNYLDKKIIDGGKKTQKMCSFNKRKNKWVSFSSGVIPSIDEIIRVAKKHKFFEKEDPSFKTILSKNLREFCLKRRGEDNLPGEYLYFCKNILTKCLRTPRDLHSVIHELTNPEEIKKQFSLTDYPKEKTFKQIVRKHVDKFEELIDNGKIKTKADALALMFVYLREENINSFSAFFKSVIIDTIVEYLNPKIKKTSGEYTGKVIMKPYIDDIIRLIKTSEKPTQSQEGQSQSQSQSQSSTQSQGQPSTQAHGQGQSSTQSPTQIGGNLSLEDTKQAMADKGMKSAEPLSIDELNKTSESDLVEGIKSCDKKKSFSEAKNVQQQKINEGIAGNDYSDSTEASSLSETVESTKFLYTIFGCFLIVATIEFGMFDAPPCMTHTIF